MSNKIILLLLFFVVVVVYFSSLPDPRFMNQTYLPRRFMKRSNHYYNLRTAIPFIVLVYLLEANSKPNSTKEINHIKNFNLIQKLDIATIIGCIAQEGELLIKRRSPDLKDVAYGIIGSLIGTLVFNLFKRLRNAK